MDDHFESDQEELEGIAVIGMAGRFPGADNLETFWENLVQGRESITFHSDDELFEKGLSPQMIHNPQFVKATAQLNHIDRFDAAFFDCTPREAQVMDPQFRLFLETAWHALENAGYAGHTKDLVTGVFAGCSFSSYVYQLISNPDLIKMVGERQVMMVNDKDHLPMQTAYKLNLLGPAVNVQSGCTTSLTATHFACQSLQDYQCDLALAGAASINTLEEYGYFYQEGGIAPPDGRCRAFDAKAQGSMRSDGLGIMVLKRLEDAVEDGDHIIAVIKASAINNDGAAKVGYAAPGMTGQTRVALAALELAEVEPDSITLMEAHGTGTPLGDPMEVTALTKAFRKSTEEKSFCALGSVKTNIGYLDATSGMASLIKAGLALHHRKIPASLNFETPNPQIDFANSPFFVNTETRDWEADDHPRRACVNGYGMGGTNAFFVMEEAPASESSPPAVSQALLLVSARTATAADAAAANLGRHCQGHPDMVLADAAYTLQRGRKHFSHRRFLVAGSTADAVAQLSSDQTSNLQAAVCGEGDREVTLIFPAQEHGDVLLNKELFQNHPWLQQHVTACQNALDPAQRSQLQKVLNAPQSAEAGTSVTHALFTAQYALGKWLLSLGLEPAGMLGCGIGCYVAGCLAGTLSLKDALALAAGPQTAIPGTLQAPQIPLISAQTGVPLGEGEAKDTDFWRGSHEAQAEATVAGLSQTAGRLLLDIGAGNCLNNLLQDPTSFQPPTVALLKETNKGITAALLNGLGNAWLTGVTIDWSQLYSDEQRLRVPLPGYAFEGKSYWVAPGRFPQQADSESTDKVDIFERPADLASEYVAPETEAQKALVGVLENQLGIAPIGIQDNYFELGGNSMLSVLLASQIGGQLGVSISPTLFMTAPTIADLASQIGDLKGMPGPGVVASPIVPLQPKGNRPPIFLVHPMGGGLFVYRDLARYMDRDQPLFGLQAADLTDVTDNHTSIEEMAGHYLKAIDEFRPEGPIVIGGWSFGGYVAYEMARQATEAGREVPALLILDTAAPNEVITSLEEAEDMELLFSAGRDAARNQGMEGPVLTDELKQLPPEEQLDHLLDFLHGNNLLSRDKGHDWMKRIARGWQIRGKAVNQYKPKTYDGHTIVFRATQLDEEQLKMYPEAYAQVRKHPLIGWDEFVPTTQIKVHDMPGFHNTIASGPNSKLIVTHLRAGLDRLGFGENKCSVGE